MTESASYKLDEWSLVYGPDGDPRYHAPEQITQHLFGKVYGDLRRDDGRTIVTSPIVGRTPNGLVITKGGSRVELGTAKSDYEQLFPGAKERLLSTLPVR